MSASSYILAACINLAAAAYGLPPTTLHGIYAMEGGWPGLAKSNTNGTHDFGPFQINSIWLPTFQRYWGLSSPDDARRYLQHDVCANTQAAAAILRYHWDETQDLRKAIGRYHSRTPKHSERYLRQFEARMSRNYLLSPGF